MDKRKKYDCLKHVCKKFDIKIESIEPFGNGKINKTFKVTSENGKIYILQCVSNKMGDVEVLMNNTKNIIDFFEDKKFSNLKLINANNKSFCKIKDKYFRMFEFCSGKVFETISNNKRFEKAGKAFGEFSKNLEDFNVEKISPLMPDFHNTLKIYDEFIDALKKDVCGRSKLCYEQIINLISKNKYVDMFEKLKINLPKRIIHGDTKLNNLIFDETGENVRCVVDYDTVMPNYLCYDFGDAIRSGCNMASEDETDFSKVRFNLGLYKSFTKGFLSVWGESLTEEEIKSFTFAPMLVTYELSLRFLTDYLKGDVYFLIKSKEDNLNRCKNQLALLVDMERYEKIFRSEILNFCDNENQKKSNKTLMVDEKFKKCL